MDVVRGFTEPYDAMLDGYNPVVQLVITATAATIKTDLFIVLIIFSILQI
jgi:hypothetical protein